MREDSSGNKLKRRRGEGSQTDDGVDSSLDEQAAEINSKLDKRLNVVCEFYCMKMRLIELEDKSKKLKEVSKNTVYTCANMRTTRELNGLEEEVENLKPSNIKLEAYTGERI